MHLSEKIASLRKSRGISQEELAEQLNVSRQAVSRWEVGSATPDAGNIVRLSQLFQVSTDYLLLDDAPHNDTAPSKCSRLMAPLVCLEVMVLLLQVLAFWVLQNPVLSILSLLPFAAILGGFEYACRKTPPQAADLALRRRFYQISLWLGSYFPLRLAITALTPLYPRPYSSLTLEAIILAVYLAVCLSLPRSQKH